MQTNEDMQKLASEYAAVAENLLQQNGTEFTEDDVIKVAEFLIDQDYPETEKTAEEELQDIRVAAFNDELEKDAFVGKFFSNVHGAFKGLGQGVKRHMAPHTSKVGPNPKGTSAVNRFFANRGDATVGYGAAALGVGTVGAAGYGVKKAITG